MFYVYPWLVGQCADLAFGHFSIPLFVARHPVIYAEVQLLPRIGYMCLSLASLDLFFLLFLYRVFDENLSHTKAFCGDCWPLRARLKAFVGRASSGGKRFVFVFGVDTFVFLPVFIAGFLFRFFYCGYFYGFVGN